MYTDVQICSLLLIGRLLCDFFVFGRYIVHSDGHNPYLSSMEDFAIKLEEFEPDLLVVGGLQMMDNFPFQAGLAPMYLWNNFLPGNFYTFHSVDKKLIISGERKALLSHLAELLSSSNPKIGVHFEMASFVEESIMEDLLQYVVPHVCFL